MILARAITQPRTGLLPESTATGAVRKIACRNTAKSTPRT